MFDINDIRAWHTLILMACFIGIVIWAYSGRRRGSFDEAANLPFADEQLHARSVAELQQTEQHSQEKK